MSGRSVLFLIAIAILHHEVTSTSTKSTTTTIPDTTTTASTSILSTTASSTTPSTTDPTTSPPPGPVYNITGLKVSSVSPCSLKVSWSSNCTTECNYNLTYTGPSDGTSSKKDTTTMEIASLPDGMYTICVTILENKMCVNGTVAKEAPGKVQNVKFSKNPRNVTLMWTPATNYNCTAVTKEFMLTLEKSGNVSANQSINVPSNSTSYTFIELEPCTEYIVSVEVISDVANTSSGYMTESTSVEAPPKPIVSAVAISPDTLHVNWTISDVTNCNISNYIVEWRSVTGNSSNNITLDYDQREYSIGNLTETSTYTVSVTAVSTYENASLDSESSSVDISTCGPIISLNKTMQNACGFLLSWENTCTQSYNYTVTWQGPTNSNISTTNTSESIQNLKSGDYYMCVSSTWNSKDFKCLNVSIVKEAPGKVQNVTFANNPRNLTVMWIPATNYSCTVVTKGYMLTVHKSDNVSANQSINVPSSSTNYTFKQLEPCTEYTVSVEVISDVANTSSGNMTESTSAVAPLKPVVNAVAISPGTLHVNWTEYIVSNSNCNITNYIFEWGMDPGNITSNITMSSDVMEISISNLTDISTYTVSVTAVTTYENVSLESESSSLDISTCGPVISLDRTEQNYCGFLLSWKNTCVESYNYTVTWQGPTKGSIDTTKTSESFQNLPTGDYNLCVSSTWNSTDFKCLNTSIVQAPGKVENVTFGELPRNLTVKWTPAKKYNCTVITKGYMLSLQKSEKGSGKQSANVSSNSTHYTFKQLDPCTEYTVSVESIAAVTNSSSGNKTASTAIEAPGIPKTTTTQHSPDSILVKWEQPKVNPCPVDHFNVSWRAQNSSTVKSMTVNTTSYTIKGLKHHTTYGINVTAVVSYQNNTATNSSPELQETTGGGSSTSGNALLFNVIFIAFLNIFFASALSL